MILVFSGWGILGLVIPALFGFAASSLAASAGLGPTGAFAALGVALSGLVVHLLGKRLNGPKDERIAAWRTQREAELHHLVENGAFVRSDGTRPTSLGQARAEAAALLDAEAAHLQARSTNRHSLFFVPLQHIGALLVIGGIVVAFVQRAQA